MTAISSSSNIISQPVVDSTNFIRAAQAGIKICNLISVLASANLAHEVYQDPSLMNPWSERTAQITWLSPDHLRCMAMGLPMMISGILMDLVAKEKAKLAKLNEETARLFPS